jgi:hypothetical protein
MKKIVSFICFFFLITGVVCAQKNQDLEIVSPNFIGFTGTLLIENCSKEVITKILNKRFSKFYEGDFEMIEENDGDQRIYKDLKKFPFILRYKSSSDSYRFEMTDRVTGKIYYTSWNAANTLPPYANMNSYAKELEKLRGK